MRHSRENRSVRTLALAGAIAALSVATTACGDDSNAETTGTNGPSESTTTEAPVTTEPTATTTTMVIPEGEDTTVSRFAHPFSLVKPATWTDTELGAPEVQYSLMISSEDPQPSLLTFVIPAASTPELLLEELAHAVGHTVGAAEDVTVGERPATRLALTPAGTGADAFLFAVGDGGSPVMFDGYTGLLYIVDVDGSPVAVFFQAPDAVYPELAPVVEAVLATVRF